MSHLIFIRERIEIDKKKLLEIARRNAINMIKQGTLPLAQQDKAIAAIQSGGKTVDELTGNFFLLYYSNYFHYYMSVVCVIVLYILQIFVNHCQNLKH